MSSADSNTSGENINIGAIILAAGSSSRMGQPKQMLDIGGERLLKKTVEAVHQSGIKNIAVVLGFNEEQHREVLKGIPADIVLNSGWQRGMGTSIKAGLKHLRSHYPALDAALILVCDQPLLTNEIIMNLVSKYQQTKKPVVASEYSHVPGVPVLFDRSYFTMLAKLPDNEGAKKIITQDPSAVAVVPFPGGEIDLDTMDDYHAFIRDH